VGQSRRAGGLASAGAYRGERVWGLLGGRAKEGYKEAGDGIENMFKDQGLKHHEKGDAQGTL